MRILSNNVERQRSEAPNPAGAALPNPAGAAARSNPAGAAPSLHLGLFEHVTSDRIDSVGRLPDVGFCDGCMTPLNQLLI